MEYIIPVIKNKLALLMILNLMNERVLYQLLMNLILYVKNQPFLYRWHKLYMHLELLEQQFLFLLVIIQ